MIKLKYGNTNTFFIRGNEGGLLIDTDYAGTMPAFYKAIKSANIKVSDITYVLATHYHPDHMGLIGELMNQGVKLLLVDTQKEAVHFSDRIFKKDNLTYTAINETAATVISCRGSRSFLSSIGISGEIVHTPSHSNDSISLILDDGSCFVGDLDPSEFIEAYDNSTMLKNDWDLITSFAPKTIFFAHRPVDKTIIYIHGQGGSPKEAEHYRSLFENYNVIGFDYVSKSPWEAKDEFSRFFDSLCGQRKTLTVIANSIGAFYAMNALSDKQIAEAYFISPIVNMQKLIEDMMTWANVSEEELREKGVIETSFGQELSWEYLSYVRRHPIDWKVPTHILYGSQDNLTSFDTISEFAKQTGATLTVMDNGEHWFHTEEQMRFLDRWLKNNNA